MGKNAKYYFSRGKIFREKNDFLKAADCYKRAIEIEPTNAEYHAHLAHAYYRLDLFKEALAEATIATDLDPNCGRGYRQRGNAKIGLGDFQGAINDLTRALEINPDDINAYGLRAAVLQNSEDFELAIADYSEILKRDPEDLYAIQYRGDSKYKMKDYSGAIEDYGSLIKKEPENAVYHGLLSQALYRSKNFDEALNEINISIILDPGLEKAYLQRGEIKQYQGDYQGALDDYSKALEINPKYLNAYDCRGNIKSDQKDFFGAIEDYSKALEIEPKNMGILRKRCSLYAKLEDWENYLLDFARLRLMGVGLRLLPIQNAKPDETICIETSFQDFQNVLLPLLEVLEETALAYCPQLFIIWQRYDEIAILGGTSKIEHHGVVGQGYVCCTEKTLYIVSKEDLAFNLSNNYVIASSSFLQSSENTIDKTVLSTKDEIWAIPIQTIEVSRFYQDSLLNKQAMNIQTCYNNWCLAGLYDNNQMMTAIRLAKEGKFLEIKSKEFGL